MSEQTKRRSRRVFIVVLAGSLVCSMMYVSFAMGFRAGVMEDTVYIMQRC